MAPSPVVVHSGAEPTNELTTTGRASGVLLGGNQDMVAIAAGWALPSLHGAILLLEAYNLRLGHIDRQLTMLYNSGRLDGVRAVAVGQYTECDPSPGDQGDWTAIDVLRDRLSRLDVRSSAGSRSGTGQPDRHTHRHPGNTRRGRRHAHDRPGRPLMDHRATTDASRP